MLPLEGRIGERIFSILDPNNITLVNVKDLISFAKIIYTGTLQDRMKLIFQMYLRSLVMTVTIMGLYPKKKSGRF